MNITPIIILALCIAVLGYAVHRLLYERNSLESLVLHLREEQDQTKTVMREVYGVLEIFTGGIHKRIDETREITESIQNHCPQVFQQADGLVHWLEATDTFLCRLRDTAMPEGIYPAQDEERRRFVGTGRTEAIYDTVRSASTLQLASIRS